MTDAATTPYVARADDLAALTEHWNAARQGESRTVLLTAPVGGGKRALVGELCRSAVADAEDDVLLWRTTCHEEEEGLQTLLRFYASLYQSLQRSQAFRGKVEMALNSQIPNQPKRVQAWYQAFIDGLRKAKPSKAGAQVQVTLPRDNPLIGMVEIVAGISRKFPVVFEVQSFHNNHSVGICALLEALTRECSDGRLLTVLEMVDIDDAAKTWISLPVQEMLERMSDRLHTQPLTRWDATDVGRFLESRSIDGAAEAIANVSNGLPGFVAELAKWAKDNDKTDAEMADLTLGGLADTTPNVDELELPSEPAAEGQRKHATPEESERIAYLAALLGVTFPSGLLADLGGYNRDSVDDLFDATDSLFSEVQFAEPLGTWIYRFKTGLLRESVLARHQADEDKETARRVAAFLERFMVPRGFGYITKTLRLYAQNGATQRAAMLRGMALAGDQNQMWPMAHDLTNYFDEVTWPDPMCRTIHMNLVERSMAGNEAGAAEQLWNQAMAWATDKEDRRFEAWLLFAGSRLDYRRQDLYRARERANDAIKLFTSVDDKLKLAELHNHLAMIELSDGNPNAALEQAGLAEETADVVVVKAHAQYVRGLVAKRDKATWQQAIEHFQKANEMAGGVGQAQLALEAGLQLGELLLVSGQTQKAADVLGRVGQIAQGLRNPVKERAAAALLGQAQAALKNFEAALQFGERALQLTRELKYVQLEPIDLYNLGFFNLMLGRDKEAVSLFRQSRKGSDPANVGFQKELLYNLGAALLKVDEVQEAEEAFKAAIQPAEQVKDFRKLAGAQQQLAGIAGKRGDNDTARALLYKAMEAAEAGNLRDERKAIKKQLAALGA